MTTKNTDANAEAQADTASAGTATGSQQAEVGAGYRSAGAEVTSDIGQAEAYITQLKRLVAGELDYTAGLQSVALRALSSAVERDSVLQSNLVGLSNRQNQHAQTISERIQQGNQSTTERVNAIQENQLMFDNDWLTALALRNPVFLDAIAAAVAEKANKNQ